MSCWDAHGSIHMGVVPSTHNQCFKYLVDGEVKNVWADIDLFRGEGQAIFVLFDRSINLFPGGSLVILTTFGKNDGPSKRVVIHKKASLPKTTSAPLKVKLNGRKAKKRNASLTVQNESGMLKVSLRRPQPETSEPEVVTYMEQAMFREDEVNTRPFHISVFKTPRG
ncbi:unnamed protein product [Prunus armeniaca]|uniref:Uncharacterized protein n=1 Tax=Prunus armeniaca TaxID=36596 RepID=A0A6J5UHX0_PRUAR|nr:unnamed protein product [Prunus armeniaca]